MYNRKNKINYLFMFLVVVCQWLNNLYLLPRSIGIVHGDCSWGLFMGIVHGEYSIMCFG